MSVDDDFVRADRQLGYDEASRALASFISDHFTGNLIPDGNTDLRKKEVAVDFDVETSVITLIEMENVSPDLKEDVVRADGLAQLAIVAHFANLDGVRHEENFSFT